MNANAADQLSPGQRVPLLRPGRQRVDVCTDPFRHPRPRDAPCHPQHRFHRHRLTSLHLRAPAPPQEPGWLELPLASARVEARGSERVLDDGRRPWSPSVSARRARRCAVGAWPDGPRASHSRGAARPAGALPGSMAEYARPLWTIGMSGSKISASCQARLIAATATSESHGTLFHHVQILPEFERRDGDVSHERDREFSPDDRQPFAIANCVEQIRIS